MYHGAAVNQSKLMDADDDGDQDLVLEFRTQDMNLREIYAQLLATADQNTNGSLDAGVNTHQIATLALTGQTQSSQAIEGAGQLELFLAGKNLRDLLQDLARTGQI